MPSLQLQRYEQILQRMIINVVASTGITDMTDSSVVKNILAAAAREIDDANLQISTLRDLFWLDRARGEDLDERAKEIQPSGLTRIQAQRAVGLLVFSRRTNTGTTLTIPIGTTVKTSDGVVVRTVQQGVITSTTSEQIAGHGVGRDSTLISAQAVLPGESGNIASGSAVNFVAKPAGVDEVTNVTTFVQGRDQESDEAFVARIKLFIQSLALGTVQALKYAALGVTDPVSGKQVRFAHVFEDPILIGSVSLYVDDGAGTAAEVLDASPNGTSGSISAPVATIQTFTKSMTGDPFLPEMVGRTFTVASGNVANNGTWTILSVPSPSQVTYVNAGGVVETGFAGTWQVGPENVTFGLAGPPTNSAVGGEEYLYFDHFPIRPESGYTLSSSTRGTLVDNTSYSLNPASGLIRFTPALSAAEVISANYYYYTGLIAAVQKVIDGDLSDPVNFPGVRAAGVTVKVLSPAVVTIGVEGALLLKPGSEGDADAIRAAAAAAVSSYINGLGISGDVIRNEIIERIMSVEGVADVVLTLPATNVTVLDSQIPRAALADIDLT